MSDVYKQIGADYAVHSNMRSPNGGSISMGHGVLHKKSSVKRLKKKSSTEAELFGVNKYIPYNLCLIFFLHVQVYGIINNIVYRYNQITIIMDKNGRNYCTGNLRHINNRYCFVKERADKGEVKIVYCPTQMILA